MKRVMHEGDEECGALCRLFRFACFYVKSNLKLTTGSFPAVTCQSGVLIFSTCVMVEATAPP